MKSTNWKDLGEFIGIAAIVASLIFVGLQMRQSQQLATAEVATTNFANFLEVRSQQNDHIEIWTKGNSGAELDDSEILIYRVLIENAHEKEWFNSLTFRRLGLTDDFAILGLAIFLHENPGARREWTAMIEKTKKYNKAYYSEGHVNIEVENHFYDGVLTTLDRLDEKLK